MGIFVRSGLSKLQHQRSIFSYLKMDIVLILSWRRPLSYRNQSIDLLCKWMDWFLYDRASVMKELKYTASIYQQDISAKTESTKVLQKHPLKWFYKKRCSLKKNKVIMDFAWELLPCFAQDVVELKQILFPNVFWWNIIEWLCLTL